MSSTLRKRDNADWTSSVLNPSGRFYDKIKQAMEIEYQDNYWSGDAIFMERNSRDFVARIARINVNAEAICSILEASELSKPHARRLHSASDAVSSQRGLLPEVQLDQSLL